MNRQNTQHEPAGFLFRTAESRDIPEAAQIEQVCFPPNEACTPERMRERAEAAPDLFLLAVDRESGKIAGYLNGIAADDASFDDAFFTDASLHNPEGRNCFLMSLCVLPPYRGKGLAHSIMREYAGREKARGREALILTCLEEKVSLYESMGFSDLGASASVWGGEAWHEMICTLDPDRAGGACRSGKTQ